MKNKVMQGALNVVASVKCEKCGDVHDADSDGFITIFGDITQGTEKSVFEKSNFDEKGKLASSTVRCRGKCVGDILKAMEAKQTMRGAVTPPATGKSSKSK